VAATKPAMIADCRLPIEEHVGDVFIAGPFHLKAPAR
jgi:hypothetical protein